MYDDYLACVGELTCAVASDGEYYGRSVSYDVR
jgi:hypothetical protein